MEYQPARRVKAKGRQFDMKAYNLARKAAILSCGHNPLFLYWRNSLKQPVQPIPEFTFDDVEEIEF